MIPERFGLFQASYGNLALPAEKLIQVLERPRLYGAPGLSEFVVGLLIFEAQVVPVLQFDLLHSGAAGSPPFVVLCGSTLGLVGFSCESVRQIAASATGRYEAAPDSAGRGTVGHFFHQAQTYPVIDVDLLVECLPE